jgi:Apea-like HEPN
MEPLHLCDVTRLEVEPTPLPRPYEKPELLAGIWFDGVTGDFADVLNERPADPNLTQLTSVLVIDSPSYARGLRARLQLEIGSGPDLEKKLLGPAPGLEYPFEDRLELYIEEGDLIRLVMVSCILAGAMTFIIDRPIRVEMKTSNGSKTPVSNGGSNLRYIWQCPRLTREERLEGLEHPESLAITSIQQLCMTLEPYFRPVQWRTGRLAVALGSFLSYALATDDVQGYLSLMTVFEALLSTGKTEITHQIAERTAFLLEHNEEGRLDVYKRIKHLYDTRSRLVHGDVKNLQYRTTNDKIRIDAKFKIVPDKDYHDLFTLCQRLLTTIFGIEPLMALLEQGDHKELNEWYLRLVFRGTMT